MEFPNYLQQIPTVMLLNSNYQIVDAGEPRKLNEKTQD